MKIGIQSGSSVRELGAERAYKLYAEAGFETIDWNLNSGLSSKQINSLDFAGNAFEGSVDEVEEYFSAEYAELRKNGLEVTRRTLRSPHTLPESPNLLIT